MQYTSPLYEEILTSNNYYVETAVSIGDVGHLIDENGNAITFGVNGSLPEEKEYGILLSGGNYDAGYGDNMLLSVKTTRRAFKNNVPEVGCCTSGEIYIEMFMPSGIIKQKAMIVPMARLVSREDGRESEWIRKGVFYVDTRTNTHNDDSLDILSIHGYDAMMMTDQIYPSTSLAFPAKDIDVVRDIASKIGVDIAEETIALINKQYEIKVPIQYTMREVLGFIGGMYCGNWIINDLGELQLLTLYSLPEETALLLDENGYYITFADGNNPDNPEGFVRIKLNARGSR